MGKENKDIKKEEVAQEVEQVEEAKSNNFSNKEVLTDTKPVIEYDAEAIAIRMPTGTTYDIKELNKVFKKPQNTWTDEESTAINLMFNTEGNVRKYTKRVDKEDFPNFIEYGDSSLGIIKSTAKVKKTKGRSNVSRQLGSLLSLNPPHQIPMYTSGFRIVLGGAPDLEIIELQNKLASAKVDIGRKTNGLVLSNESVMYYQIIAEYLEEQMTHCTLDLKDGKLDIRDYVDVRDIDSWIWGIACTAHPKGFNLVRTCKNAYKSDDGGNSLQCTDTVTSKVNIRYMLRPDKSKLQDKHLSILARKAPDSVTVQDVEEYKRLLPDLIDDTYTITIDELTFKFKFKFPTLSEYINNGNEWVEELTNMVDNIIGKDATADTREKMYNNAIASVYLSVYNSYFAEVTISSEGNQDIVYTDKEDIRGVLDIVSKDNKGRNGLMKHILRFISINTTTIVGIPDYECENCKTRQVKENPDYNPEFKNIIPLNPLKTFLDLCVVTKDQVMKRSNIKM